MCGGARLAITDRENANDPVPVHANIVQSTLWHSVSLVEWEATAPILPLRGEARA